MNNAPLRPADTTSRSVDQFGSLDPDYWDGYFEGLAEGRKQKPPVWWREACRLVIGFAVGVIAFLFL